MKLYFLKADQPIVKTYHKDPVSGDLTKNSYPFVYEFTSFEEEVNSLTEFEAALQKHSKLGHCLLKGQLARPLVNESRAGATDKNAKTIWMCLDLDGVKNYQTVDLFLNEIGLGEVSYILQWSSSMGIENEQGFRCHIFIILSQETHPQILKHYLTHQNLVAPNLVAQLTLTKTNNAIRYPLDITTCQNDKLLYIAPPKITGALVDPYSTSRISLVKKSKDEATLSTQIPSVDTLRQLGEDLIDKLRETDRLPRRKRMAKYAFNGTTEYLANPERATITSRKIERDFVYLNLNGGDSWGYYHPVDNPMFIHNFKGEPVYRTKDLLPEYWAELSNNGVAQFAYGNAGPKRLYLAFRDFKTSCYYNGIYEKETGRLTLAQAKSEGQLRHFMTQHGQPLGEFIPDWDIIFDPENPVIVDPVKQIVNTYQASEYVGQEIKNITTVPPVTRKIIDHALGGDPATTDHFINWLACVVQFRTRTGTAWVLQGTQGTGKGLLYHRILSPIMGPTNCATRRMEELDSQFTDFMENKFLVFIDEIESGRALYFNKIVAKLKNLIVEPTISIRRLYQGAFESKNRSNMIFASNKATPVEVAPDDRRFNVGMYQKNRLNISDVELDTLTSELPDFYSFLMTYPADTDRARFPINNEARRTLIDISRTSFDVVSDALLAGNISFFKDQLLEVEKEKILDAVTALKYGEYKNLVDRILAAPDKETKITREELNAMYNWCVGDIPTQPGKFTAMLKHYRIYLAPIWKDGKTMRGLEVNWKINEDNHGNKSEDHLKEADEGRSEGDS